MSYHQSDAAFDAMLDDYQAQEAEWAAENERRSYETAGRPDAIHLQIPFSELRPGDFMTAEQGPGARWVKVTGVTEKGAQLAITFETPEPLTVGMHSKWTIERDPTDTVTIDAAAREDVILIAGDFVDAHLPPHTPAVIDHGAVAPDDSEAE